MRMRWLADMLRPRLARYAETHPDPQIIRNGSETNLPYLKRWKLVDAQWNHPGVYLHNMLMNDDATLHDHPYASLSIALTDGLIEEYVPEPDNVFNHPRHTQLTKRKVRAGDVIYRSSRFAHRLTLEPGCTAWTLFIPFRRLKKGWGFWCLDDHRFHETYHLTRRRAIAAGKTGPYIGCGEENEHG